MSDTYNITSIDFVVGSLYESKFNEWLVNNDLNSIITNHDWKIKSEDLNIQLHLINEEDKAPFIKCKFHIGMLHVKSKDDFEKVMIDMALYAEKPELLGFIITDPLQEDRDLYLHFSYRFNLLKELHPVEYFNIIFKQLKDIVSDVEFRLGVVLSDFILQQEDDNDEQDEFESDDDPFKNDGPIGNRGGNKSPVSPYTGGE
jgi:hypothetical protein